jgi:ATP-binding cassette subfamily B protein
LGIVVLVAAVPIVFTSMSFERRYVKVSRRVQDQKGDVATQVEEAALGIRVIKSFGRGRHAFDKYDVHAHDLYESSMSQVRLSARFWTFLEVLPNLALVLVLLLGALAVGDGALTLGTLIAFVTLMLSLIWPVASLGVILAMAQEAMTAADRVLEILDTRPTIVGGDVEIDDPRGRVRFENVGFTFPDAPSPVLAGVDLDIEPGETLAVVGATGAGKTVLTRSGPTPARRHRRPGADRRRRRTRPVDGLAPLGRRHGVRGAHVVQHECAREPHARASRRDRRRGQAGASDR